MITYHACHLKTDQQPPLGDYTMSSRDLPFSELTPYEQAFAIGTRALQLSVHGHAQTKLVELPEKGNATSDIDVAHKELTTGRVRVHIVSAPVAR